MWSDRIEQKPIQHLFASMRNPLSLTSSYFLRIAWYQRLLTFSKSEKSILFSHIWLTQDTASMTKATVIGADQVPYPSTSWNARTAANKPPDVHNVLLWRKANVSTNKLFQKLKLFFQYLVPSCCNKVLKRKEALGCNRKVSYILRKFVSRASRYNFCERCLPLRGAKLFSLCNLLCVSSGRKTKCWTWDCWGFNKKQVVRAAILFHTFDICRK